MSGDSRGLPLRPTLVSIVVLLILSAVGGVGAMAYLGSSRVVEVLWRDFSDHVASSTMERSMRYFEAAIPYADLTDSLAEAGNLDPYDEVALLDYFRRALHANPRFTWASWGGMDGTYVAAHREPDGQIAGTIRQGPERGGRRIEYRAARDGWLHLSEVENTYDPRSRPWFPQALAEPEGAWVEPFLFATEQRPGFMYTRVHRRDGEVVGVWAVEYEMSYLSDFLSALRVSDHGRVYIVTEQGKVVGHPMGQTAAVIDGEADVARAEDHEDAWLAGAWTEYQRTRESNFGFGSNRAIAREFPDESGMDWIVMIVAPSSDLFGWVQEQARKTAFIALFILLVAIVAGMLSSNHISRALSRVARQMDRLGHFDVRPPEQAGHSIVREVNAMQGAAERMRRSLRSFGRYVPTALVRQLLESGQEAELGGREARLTMLFSDIVGFTSVAEKMTPDELVTLLAEYFGEMSDAIRDEGGTVDKFIGDAIMAFWGAPVADEAHELRACRGALAMRRTLTRLQAGWDERGLPTLGTRIGLNTGDVIVGNIGSVNRLNYTVMGDAVNLASRLEALNKHYDTAILIGEETAAAVGDAMLLRPIDLVAVKGRAVPILIYELIDEKSSATDAQRAAVRDYAAALEAYRDRRFEEAIPLFERAAAHLGGDDPPSLHMVERCRHLQEDPPPPDWDGRRIMQEK